MDTVEQRLQILEHDLSRSRRVNQVLGVAVLAVVCIAGAPSKMPVEVNPLQHLPSAAASRTPRVGVGARTMEAGQLILVDALGRPRIRMQVTDQGSAISMLDEKGRKRLELGETSTASGLCLFDSDVPVVSLQFYQQGDPALEIKNGQGTARMKADGFTVHDASNEGRLNLSLFNGNYPVLGLSRSGQNGPPSIELTANEASGSVKLHDKLGHPLFSVAVTDDGKTFLNMGHPAHERLLQISADRAKTIGPAIEFFTPARKDGSGGLLPRLQLGVAEDHEPYIRMVGQDGRIQPLAAPPQSARATAVEE
jgi:hypothetical protein